MGQTGDDGDRIALRDHVIEAEIGAFQAERGVRQRLRFTLVADLARRVAEDDDVDHVLSYDVLVEAVEAAMAGPRRDLLETVAEDAAAHVLATGRVARVSVRAEKLDRVSGALGVEISRLARRGTPAGPVLDAGGIGRAVVLGRAAMADPGLGAALDRLEVADCPVILCAAAAPALRPVVGVAAVQRRIDLLALDQAAWELAAHEPRACVVGSRTELLWGLRHGQMSAWAPSRMVADARDPAPESLNPAHLATWLAADLNLDGVDAVGCEAPGVRQVRLADLGRVAAWQQ